MSTDIVMPNLGFDTQEGKLIEWLKQPGERVTKGEAIAVIESDKANVELESVGEGVLLEQLFPEGEDIAVGAVIARVGQEGEPVTEAPTSPEKVTTEESAPALKTEASPIARRLAKEHNVDLAAVEGSGPRGRIKRGDIEDYLKSQESTTVAGGPVLALPKVRKAAREAGIDLAAVRPSGSRGQITQADLDKFQTPAVDGAPESIGGPEGAVEVPLSRVRQVIGQRLGASMREAPHFYVTGEFDLEAALNRLKEFDPPQPRLNDLIQYLTAQTLRQVPALNATFENGHLYHHQVVNLAIAVAREDGLITPVLRKADRYSLSGLAAEARELIERTRENRLTVKELSGGTFTISNLGVIRQVDRFTAVINPPQVAILAVGTVKPRPIVHDNGLFIRHTVHLTLSGDHRAVDGMHLGQFMAAFQEKLDQFNQGQEL